jgi:CII-binding regulator of phage lambda lysogenization HflD
VRHDGIFFGVNQYFSDLMKEFLRLSSVDNQQVPRVKAKIAACERRLKKSADIIAHMQRKLSNYAEQLHELNVEPVFAPEEDKSRTSG